jgi:putative ABC transport system permease protein
MGIIIKYTLKSIKEKKMRTFLIIVAISLSVALTFSSLALKDAITGTFTEMFKKYIGTANLMISADKDSPSATLKLRPLVDGDHLIEYQIGVIDAQGTYKLPSKDGEQRISIRGYEESDLPKLGVVKLMEKLDEPFVGKSIYIAQSLASANGWQLGETIELTINGARQKVRIHGLGVATGALSNEGATAYTIMPASTLQRLANMQGQFPFLLIKTSEHADIDEAKAYLKTLYPRYRVDEPIPWEEINSALNMITVPFLFMLLLVLSTAIFIIYTAFKVIVAEKLPVLGTFRSIGATKGTTDFILLMESILYGMVGGLIGIWLGNFMLAFMLKGITQDAIQLGSEATPTTIASIYYISSWAFGVVLSLLSALFPILSVSKISVRDIVLGSISQVKENKPFTLVIALLLFGIAIAIPKLVTESSGILLSGIAMILLCLALVMLTPFFTTLAVNFLERIIPFIFGNLGLLAVKNIRGNKSILNNIALLTLGISGILLINTISHSVSIEVLDAYSKANFQVFVATGSMDKQTLQSIKGIRGVSNAVGAYAINNAKVEGSTRRIGTLQGVESLDFLDYWSFPIVTDFDEAKANFGRGRTMILSTTLKDAFKVDIGDIMRVEVRENTYRDYYIIGFTQTLMNNGNYALVNASDLKRDAQLPFFSEILVKTIDPDQTAKRIEERFSKNWSYIKTLEELEKNNQESNAMLFALLQGFSLIAMGIGIFGILNNFVVSLLSRQRHVAIMRSVGMSKRQTRQMLSIEALMSGFIGGAFAVIGSLFLIAQVGVLLKLINLPIPLHYSPPLFIIGFIAAGVISLISNYLPALRSSKMSIVQAIKFE